MKLIKFRIVNYKSIKDSGECNLEDKITILAGKNEAGKTAILQALEDFNSDRMIRDEAKPFLSPKDLPEIRLTLDYKAGEIDKICKSAGIALTKSSDIRLEITKRYPSEYSVDEHSLDQLLGETRKVQTDREHQAVVEYKKLVAAVPEPSTLHGQIPPLVTPATIQLAEDIANFSAAVSNSPELDEDTKSNVVSIIEKLKGLLVQDPKLEDIFLTELKKNMPNFILFSSFEDDFQSETPIDEVGNTPIVKDLVSISQLNLDIVTKGLSSEKAKHRQQVNLAFNEKYKKFWSQDYTSLYSGWEDGKLCFFIEEDGEYYPLQMRSQGRRWHLSFYIRTTARSQEGSTNILLIDEPGLFLHATAQQDILKKLEDISLTSQVVFTTHSPYLMNHKEFDRIRLVYRGQIPKQIEGDKITTIDPKFAEYYTERTHKTGDTKYYVLTKKLAELTEEDEMKIKGAMFRMNYNIGTYVEQKIHKVADKETLTPILTAIGLELTSGIVNLDKKLNVICEGPSDIFYLQGFRNFVSSDDINFIFGGGAGNMPMVGTILSGWGCHVLYLYDNDKGRKDNEKTLKKDWMVTKAELLSPTDVEGGTIEDVLAPDDFRKYVLEDEKTKYTGTNSEYVKAEKKDKVILARQFKHIADGGSMTLSPASKKNISAIFLKLSAKFTSSFS